MLQVLTRELSRPSGRSVVLLGDHPAKMLVEIISTCPLASVEIDPRSPLRLDELLSKEHLSLRRKLHIDLLEHRQAVADTTAHATAHKGRLEREVENLLGRPWLLVLSITRRHRRRMAVRTRWVLRLHASAPSNARLSTMDSGSRN